MAKFAKDTCAGFSFLIKLHAGSTISTSNGWYTCIFFIGSLKKKSKHSASLPQCAFTHNWKVQCLFALPIISNVRWWCAEKLKIRIRQGSVLNVVKTYGFLSSIYSWSRLFFMLKNDLLEITRHFIYYLSYIVAKKNFVIFFQALRHPLRTFQSILQSFQNLYFKNSLLCKRNKWALSVKV